jgi:mevalonate kinase
MAFAPGKVILLGEHAVVYGRTALACALDRGITATAARAERTTLRLEPWGLSIDPSERGDDRDDIAVATRALLSAYGLHEPVSLHVSAQIPAGNGLGCSAAIAVALVRALDELTGKAHTPDEVADLSLVWERVFHGTPSGIDTTIASRGGVGSFRKAEGFTPILARHPLTLVVATSGTTSSTKTMVEHVATQRARNPERVERAMGSIDALARNAGLAVEHGRLAELGALMDLNHSLLSSLMLSTERLETLRRIARENGALGSKLTGAGGGGALVTLAVDDENARTIEAALKAEGSEAFVVRVGAP